MEDTEHREQQPPDREPNQEQRERTDHTAFLYRHSRRDPCRSRYRSQPNVRRQRAARFLSVCVHNACAFWMHFSNTSLIETLERASTHGPITSSHGSPSYRSICSSDAIWTKSVVSNHQA